MSTRRRGKSRMGGVTNKQVQPIQLRKNLRKNDEIMSLGGSSTFSERTIQPITTKIEKEVVKQLKRVPEEAKQAIKAAVNLVPNNPLVKRFTNTLKKAKGIESNIIKKILKKENELKILQDLLKKCRNCI